MQTEVAAFNPGGGTGNVSITGIGFTPKLTGAWVSGETSNNTLSNFLHKRGIGWAASAAAQHCVSTHSEDGAGAGDTGQGAWEDRWIQNLDSAEGDDGRADFVSNDADGFTYNIVTAFAINTRIHTLAISGNDITDVVRFKITEGAAPGVVTASLGIAADMITWIGKGAGNGTATAVDSRMMIGFSTRNGTGNMVWCGGSNNGSDPTQTQSYCNDVECIAAESVGVTSINSRGRTTAWGATSVDVTMDAVSGGADRDYFGFAVKGGRWQISSMLTQTDLVTDMTATLAGTIPKMGILLSHCKTESVVGTPDEQDDWSMGAWDSGLEEVGCYVTDEDNVATANTNVQASTIDSYFAGDRAAAVKAFASVKSVQFGSATHRMDDADSEQNFITVLLGGDEDPTFFTPPTWNLPYNIFRRQPAQKDERIRYFFDADETSGSLLTPAVRALPYQVFRRDLRRNEDNRYQVFFDADDSVLFTPPTWNLPYQIFRRDLRRNLDVDRNTAIFIPEPGPDPTGTMCEPDSIRWKRRKRLMQPPYATIRHGRQ